MQVFLDIDENIQKIIKKTLNFLSFFSGKIECLKNFDEVSF